jgi:hypothetical protein
MLGALITLIASQNTLATVISAKQLLSASAVRWGSVFNAKRTVLSVS